MGSETGKTEKPEENNQEQIQKDEIPPDTQISKQYIESPGKIDIEASAENNAPGKMIIQENNYETNEDGVHTKVNERRVEYHITKVNQESQDNEENAEVVDNDENMENIENEENIENAEYEENEDQMEENVEGEYEIQQEEVPNDDEQGKEEFIESHQIYETQNKNIPQYAVNYNQMENNINIEQNDKNMINRYINANELIDRNIQIHPNENVYLQTGGYQNYSSYHSNIPRYMTFQKSEMKETGNIRSSLNVVKTEDVSELVEIPKSEYATYAGRETVFVGGGMDTGEYKFRGQGIAITQNGALEEKIEISEEEILKEINKRKNKPKKEKRKKYEILAKFYASTEFEGKPIYKTEKMEQLQKQYEYNQQQKYSSSNKESAAFQFNAEQSQNIESSNNNNLNINNLNINDNNLQSSSKMQNMQYELSQSNAQSQLSQNIYLMKYQNLDVNMEPNDNFSQYLFSQINQLRANPQSYINIIQQAKKNIIKDKHGRLVYNDQIRIALTRGEQAFDDAINFLRNVKPMDKLIFNPYITVEMPKTENEIRYKNDLRLKVENMVSEGIIIKSYWRDVIKNPQLSLLMMIVDDIGAKSGMRRRDLFDCNMKYIGISSVEINGCFVCYITLCAKE